MITEIIEALQLLVESSLSDVNTSAPGVVVSYDAARNRAVVKPALPKALSDGTQLEPPQIVEAPVIWPASGNGRSSLTMPLQPGDKVMLSFQQRSLEGWLQGSSAKPDDPRQFDLSDCVVHPGLNDSGTVAHITDVVLKFDKAFVQLTQDGKAIIGNDKANITIDAGGTMTLNAQTIKIITPSNSFTLETHLHMTHSSNSPTDKPIAGS